MAERVLAPVVPSRLWASLLRAWTWTMSLRPAYVLGGLVVLQWLALLALVASIRHNGWLFYQGGDETFYYSGAWGISRGHLPQTAVGYGWTLLLAPVALFAGPSYLAALPGVVLLQVLVLLPLALVFAYGIGERIAGRWLGYVCAVGFVVAPYLVIPGFEHRYHEQWVEQFLPQALGMTGLSDFFAMVATMGAAWLFLRALDSRGAGDAVLAGLLAGLSIGIKPADALFLGGVILALLVVREWRVSAFYAAGIVLPLVTLAIWKERGLGHIPVLGLTLVRVGASVLPPLGISVPSSINLDWSWLGQNMAQFREFFWSMRLVEILPFAGLAAVWRVSAAKALFLGGWLAAFVVIKGTSHRASVQDGTFFRLLMPAWPAYLVLAAALPLLFPGVAQAVKARLTRVVPVEWRTRPVLVSAALLGVVPLLVLAGLPTLKDRSIVAENTNNVVVPVSGGFDAHAGHAGGRFELTWRRPPGARGNVFYRVYRSPVSGQPAIGGVVGYEDGVACLPPSRAAADCQILMDIVATTRSTRFTEKAIPGGWSYRVGMMANWIDDPTRGDVLMISKPARP